MSIFSELTRLIENREDDCAMLRGRNGAKWFCEKRGCAYCKEEVGSKYYVPKDVCAENPDNERWARNRNVTRGYYAKM